MFNDVLVKRNEMASMFIILIFADGVVDAFFNQGLGNNIFVHASFWCPKARPAVKILPRGNDVNLLCSITC